MQSYNLQFFQCLVKWNGQTAGVSVHSTAALPIHRKLIFKQHRNFVAPYQLSEVLQEWQLRVLYFITYGSSVVICSVLPLSLNFRRFLQKFCKHVQAQECQSCKSGPVLAINVVQPVMKVMKMRTIRNLFQHNFSLHYYLTICRQSWQISFFLILVIHYIASWL